MALLSLNLQNRSLPRAGELRQLAAPLRLSFPTVDRRLVPARGLVFSALSHCAIVCGILFAPVYFLASSPVRTASLEAEDSNPESQVIYLPRLGGGSEGSGYAGGGSLIRRKGSASTPVRTSPGASYPGPQAIVSDPPQPTNKFQTILRPALKNPRTLTAFVSVPNIVQTTNAGPLVQLDSKEPARPKLPQTELKPNAPKAPRAINAIAPTILTAPVELPKLTIPTGGPQRPAPPDMKLQAPKAPVLEANATAAPQFSQVPTHGNDLQNLLSLSPSPAAPAAPVNLPDGEARGRFAISPDSNPAPAPDTPGSKARSLAASTNPAINTGDDLEAKAGNSVSEGESGVSNGTSRAAIGGNGGLGTSTGSDSGSGSGGKGGDEGRGSAAGAGLGTGAGISAGADSGAGAAAGGGSFRGVTIGPGSSASLDPRFAVSMVYPVPVELVSKLRKNTFIVSAGSLGGGGLDVYGALNCPKIYTIFLPMPGANWTMQYCVEAGAAAAAPPPDAYSTVIHLQAGLVPPDPNVDSRYDFQRLPVPAEKANKMIVLKGVLKEDGTIEGLQVYQGIVPQMDEAARIAFSRWKFKPAMREGKPVAVDLLVGIPPQVAPGH